VKLFQQFLLHHFMSEFVLLSDDNLFQFSKIFDELSVFKNEVKNVKKIREETFNVEHLPSNRV
jgi:hypothetical protein